MKIKLKRLTRHELIFQKKGQTKRKNWQQEWRVANRVTIIIHQAI
jgi:hypothetical protein